MVRSTPGPHLAYAAVVARKAGPLLLIAFLLAVAAGGGGGVMAPWLPRSPDTHRDPVTIAQVRLLTGGTSWRLRME